ncbi:MAG: protease inhibitor I42 family protein [Dehalococcoidia bacterium]|nr:protease inhibitor I42 family protein [Dehalococcoidia bacterium]
MERRKRHLTLVLGLVFLLVNLVGGCTAQQPEEYFDAGQEIEIGVGDEFIVALDSNPTTGYQWEADFDESFLELVLDEFEPGEAEEGMVGAGGEQKFTFEGLKAGETELTLTYKRSWEEDFAEQKVFVVSIT